MRAADLVGPNARNFSAANLSTIPAASGSSGPTTVKSTRFSFANPTSACRSVAGIATFSAMSPVPAFPGAQKSRSAYGDCRSFHVSACSRPPLPMTRIFIDYNRSGTVEAAVSAAKRSKSRAARLPPTINARLACFSREDAQFQFFRVPNDREGGADADLISNQDFVQMVHAPDRLAIKRHDQIALSQSC